MGVIGNGGLGVVRAAHPGGEKLMKVTRAGKV